MTKPLNVAGVVLLKCQGMASLNPDDVHCCPSASLYSITYCEWLAVTLMLVPVLCLIDRMKQHQLLERGFHVKKKKGFHEKLLSNSQAVALPVSAKNVSLCIFYNV